MIANEDKDGDSNKKKDDVEDVKTRKNVMKDKGKVDHVKDKEKSNEKKRCQIKMINDRRSRLTHLYPTPNLICRRPSSSPPCNLMPSRSCRSQLQ